MSHQIILTFCMFVCLSEAVWGQTTRVLLSPDPTNIESRVQALEKSVVDQQASTKAEAELLKKQTEGETALLKKQLNQYLFFRDWEARLIFSLLGFLLGGGAGIIWTRNKISDVVQKQSKEIEDRIIAEFSDERTNLHLFLTRLVREEAQVFEKTFAKTRWEENLKRESRILIIYDEVDNNLENDYKNYGFIADQIKKMEIGSAFDRNSEEIKIKESDYDLIVLDNLENPDVLKYIQTGKQLAYLVYYEGTYSPYPDRKRSNIANSKLTLYSRTLEVLLYISAQRGLAIS